MAAKICATREEVDNEEEEEEVEEEKEDEELDEEEEDDEEMIWIALFTWLSHISYK